MIQIDEARTPSSDSRPESIRPNVDSLRKLRHIDSKGNWSKRYDYIKPLVLSSMCEVLRLQAQAKTSLGVFRPAEVIELKIEKGDDQWGPSKQALAHQGSLLAPAKSDLERFRGPLATGTDVMKQAATATSNRLSIGRSQARFDVGEETTVAKRSP